MENAQLQRAAAAFQERYGRAPTLGARAPGRVNLIGEHTDYNGGFVLPMAIERDTILLAAPRADDEARIGSAGSPASEARFPLSADLEPGEPAWANYVRGVVAGCLGAGLAPGGFDAWIDSEIPRGGGLSSSAALEVATATLLERLSGHALDPVRKALIAQEAEHRFAGVPCGIMDQFAVTLARTGAAMLLDCRSREIQHVGFADPEVTVLIADTRVAHQLAGGEYADRRRECERAAEALGVTSLREATLEQLAASTGSLDETAYRRARHVIGENDRTTEAAECLEAGAWARAGACMSASHRSLRDDFAVSCRELDELVSIAESFGPERGVYGSRMTGGGFGGCTVTLLASSMVEEVAESLRREYAERIGHEPSLFVSRPAAGSEPLVLA